MIEGDDDASTFVTFEEITTIGPAGPIMQRVQVPLDRMLDSGENSHMLAQMDIDTMPQTFQDDVDMNNNNDEEPRGPGQKNKVISNIHLLCTIINNAQQHAWMEEFVGHADGLLEALLA